MRLGDLLTPERIRIPLRARTVREGFAELLELVSRDRDETLEPLSLPAVDDSRRPRALGRSRLLTLSSGKGEEPWLALGVAPRPLAEPSDAAKAPEEVEPARILVLVGGGGGLTPEAGYRIQTTLAESGVEKAVLQGRDPDEVLRISQLTEMELRRPLRVEDVMTPLRYRVYPHTPVREVVDLIARRRLEAVPVVGENLQLLGVVSASDALDHSLRLEGGTQRDADRGGSITVRDVMTRSVLCVSEDQSLIDAAQVMANRSVGQLPVVREGEVVGFLSREEVLLALAGSEEGTEGRGERTDPSHSE